MVADSTPAKTEVELLASFRALRQDEYGQDLVEYALLVALIAIIVIAALVALGPIISSVFNNISSNLGAGT